MSRITLLLVLVLVSSSGVAQAQQTAESRPVSEGNQAVQNAAAPKPSEPASQEGQEVLARFLEQSFANSSAPESVRMLIAITRGSQMGPGEGWFGPAQSRYSWSWLASLHGIEPSQEINQDTFRGSDVQFSRLDRNKDGNISASDLDWSDRNPFVQQSYMVNRMFRRIDQDGNGQVNREEINQFFQYLAADRDSFRSEDLRNALIGGPSGFAKGDGPTPEILVRGLFRGEIGSLNEGPGVGEPAPDFRLTTHDASQKIRLSEQFGSKPVVLIFGNFTCGPFRSMYPMVEEISERYRDQATFISIYVREAHPSDGWHMESNAKVGVKVNQPTTYDERRAVAQQCHDKLKYSMPLLVDEIHDPVGNAYSGMPARLYVIDPSGTIAYKSGRGPFGFRTEEMEQALVMTLLDSSTKSAAAE